MGVSDVMMCGHQRDLLEIPELPGGSRVSPLRVGFGGQSLSGTTTVRTCPTECA